MHNNTISLIKRILIKDFYKYITIFVGKYNDLIMNI